ncbi:nucleoside deaminase [Aquihabitans sp. G128]|uniref:nucleoside deaminase n=1 Tax=Aquihabitans sp. G128 TaxID=2849779 RepID=UPI001C2258B5|nr:nucleoside deaminase [Aquihabitans sp. G128]QXC59588.1 nucleoside deaminase [Aquihabitans sp. G128]
MAPDDVAHLKRCLELAQVARARGDEPFGSILVGPDGEVLAERENAVHSAKDVTAHPELALAAWASRNLTPEQRAASTMFTSCEHCAMCAGAHYWAGIGRLVFALSGAELAELVPGSVPTLSLSASEVFLRGNRPIIVEGPCEELAAEARGVFDGAWEQ